MTLALDAATAEREEGPSLRQDARLIGTVSVAHFLSHVYILALPPLFPVLGPALGVDNVALGAALAVLNAATTLAQTPLGVLVDRLGARRLLALGLVLFGLGVGLVGVVPWFGAVLALMVIAGLGNAAFHPCDYAILNAAVNPARMGRAFAVHTFAGYLGFAVAPPLMVVLAAVIGWQAALLVVGATCLPVVAAVLLGGRRMEGAGGRRVVRPSGAPSTLALMASPQMLVSLLFFILMALAHAGFTSFSVGAFMAVEGWSLEAATLPLTAYLFLSAGGVLVGGWVAERARHPRRVIGSCYLVAAGAVALVAMLPVTLAGAVAAFALAGLASGIVAPSRDMLLRQAAPAGQFGVAFGFVMSGFNLGGILGPPLYGWVLDLGRPDLVLWLIVVTSLMTLATVGGSGRPMAPSRPDIGRPAAA